MESQEEMVRAGLLAGEFLPVGLRAFITSHKWGSAISGGISFDIENVQPAGITTVVGATGALSSADTITLFTPPGLKSLLGKYNNDPSWDEFPNFLEQYRREIDAINDER